MYDLALSGISLFQFIVSRNLYPIFVVSYLKAMDMNEELKNQLASELRAFNGLAPTSSVSTITDAYNRIIGMVQSLMLTNEDPDSHARAWSLLRDDAYKYLSEVQEGNKNAIDDLKHKMSQVGEILSIL